MEPSSAEKPSEEQNPTAWTPEVSLRIKAIGQVRPSPDGSRVVFTVTSPVMKEEKSEYLTQIHLANADGSGSYPLTFADKSSNNPRWSPDGRSIAFTSARKEKSQLYRLRVAGGEAECLTDAKSDIGEFAWSPDGTQIAFLQADPLTEAEEKAKKDKDDAFWVDEDIKYSRLYVLPVEPDAKGGREPRKLTTQDTHVVSFDWSPNGDNIAFAHQFAPKADYWTTSDISVVEVSSGEVRPLVHSAAAATAPRYSPDGSKIAFGLSDTPPTWAFHCILHIVDAAGGVPQPLTQSFDGQPNLIGWAADGVRLYFGETRHTGVQIFTLHTATGEIAQKSTGEGVYGEPNLNVSRTQLGFTFQTTERAIEAWVSDAEDFHPVCVSSENRELPALPLGKTEVIRWRSDDELEIEGLLTYPVNYTPGTRVPLLLVIHGGPAGVFTQTFIAASVMYPIAAFAAQGYAVLRCNPRGSSGYGQVFRHANRKDWGGGDYNDLMRGVDTVVAMGVADENRLGVMGWSYGGFMTSWIITQTHRFKAASVGAAVTNLMSFNGTADIPGFVPCYFGAESWENLEVYRDHSPMFQVGGVQTPTLLQHGDADVRVPITQGYEFYNALKRQNVPVRMVVLPRQPHGPNEPRMVLKTAQTNLDWFEKYLKTG